MYIGLLQNKENLCSSKKLLERHAKTSYKLGGSIGNTHLKRDLYLEHINYTQNLKLKEGRKERKKERKEGEKKKRSDQGKIQLENWHKTGGDNLSERIYR